MTNIENERPVAAIKPNRDIGNRARRFYPSLTEENINTGVVAVYSNASCVYLADKDGHTLWLNSDSYRYKTTKQFMEFVKNGGIVVVEEKEKAKEIAHYKVLPETIRRTSANRNEENPSLLIMQVNPTSRRIIDKIDIVKEAVKGFTELEAEQIRRDAILAVAGRCFGQGTAPGI
jgi:hypothetical protein